MNKTRKAALLFAGSIAAVAAIELTAQVVYWSVASPHNERLLASGRHYYRRSQNSQLAYELRPSTHIVTDGRELKINSRGLRGSDDGADSPGTVALLGDSVPFGLGLTERDTPASNLESMLSDTTRVHSITTPGYGLEEIAELLDVHLPQLRPELVCYVLNLNDFSLRDTVYEGADNGLFRLYSPPSIKSIYLTRKAIYRAMKAGQPTSVEWYRWLFSGSSNHLLRKIPEMRDRVESGGGKFVVVPFPPRVAFSGGAYALEDIELRIEEYLDREGVSHFSVREAFASSTEDLQDPTDHLTAAGSRVLAHEIHRYWQQTTQDR